MNVVDANQSYSPESPIANRKLFYSDHDREEYQDATSWGYDYGGVLKKEPNETKEIILLPSDVDIAPLKLRKAIRIVIDREADIFSFQNDDLNITSIGFTKEEALENFCGFLSADYLSYINTPDEQLSLGGRELKLKYRMFIG